MSDFELVMPRMGESIMEATILKWLKNPGDPVEEDETILEIATDKVDSEIPSPVQGILKEIRFAEDDVVPVGEVIALISAEVQAEVPQGLPENGNSEETELISVAEEPLTSLGKETRPTQAYTARHHLPPQHDGRFYSPLVRSIAEKEGLTIEELANVPGTGLQGRVTKKDLLSFLAASGTAIPEPAKPTPQPVITSPPPPKVVSTLSATAQDEIIEMDRMRKMIADHMVQSKRTSAHVTSFIEADVTEVVKWRTAHKQQFSENYGGTLTYTPIFIYAVAKAIRDFPRINASVDDDKIIIRHQVNIGMATALPNGNLIVPVIKEADNYSISGLGRIVNDLAARAREGSLKPDEIQGGTFTLTNVGSFGNVMGTPIINQPQVAIMATGAIKKKPAVVETAYGDLIAVRHLMYLSLSYDHRVVDGQLGGSFLRRVADYLEEFNDGITP